MEDHAMLHGMYVLLMSFLALLLPLSCTHAADTKTLDSGFVVLDGTLSTNKPALSAYGIKPAHIIYEGMLWSRDQWSAPLPDAEVVRQRAREALAKGQPVVINIERRPLRGDPSVVADSLQRYLQVLRWFRSEEPGLRIGYYSTVPIRDYWRAIQDRDSPDYKAWQKENNALRPLAREVDVAYPSLYTFYEDRAGWVKYAEAQLREAKRYSKLVYAFL